MNDPAASAAGQSNLRLAFRFVRQRWILIAVVSVAVLLPVFWHQRIEAGDLASHTYNAWLAGLVENDQAPGLYIVHQWNNILMDVTLLQLGSIFGFPVAENIVVSSCVLIFFWGAFALISTATRRPPWFLVPAIAMVAWGWTLEMGFLNYYVSLGIGFIAIAALWHGRVGDWVIGLVLFCLSLVAHPMGFACVVGIAAYILCAEKLGGWHRWILFTAALVTLLLAHFYIVRHFPSKSWETATFYLMNGTDQLALYGRRYVALAMAALLFAALVFLYGRRRDNIEPRWRFRTPLELWTIFLFAAALIPESIQLPRYAAPLSFLVARLTSITAVMGLCVLGHMKPRRWHLAGWGLIAAVFFAWLYQDTGILNGMEAQAESLVATLPYGRRVVKTMWPPADSRIYFIHHMIDRACIGRCFSYSNYEPASQQFRIRVRPGSPIVTDSPRSVKDMDEGHYTIWPEDLPVTEIYQCGAEDPTRLCMHDLKAGEETGRMGYHPPGAQ